MPRISLRNVVKRFGNQLVIARLSAEIENQELFVVVGPTGCGKTTLLRLVAGLLRPDSGEILFDGVRMNEVPPQARGVRMVFQGQDYALFPHLAIYQERHWSNLSFPLRLRGKAWDAIRERVGKVTRRMGIRSELFPRRPRDLSEGQKQRVALGKAVILPPQGPAPGRAPGAPRSSRAGQGTSGGPAATRGARYHHHLCDPRPSRGVSPCRPGGGDAGRTLRPSGHTPRDQETSRERIRRRVRRELPGNPPPRLFRVNPHCLTRCGGS